MTEMKVADEQLGGTACIITGGLLDTIHAKTAHGLVRESRRFKIIGVIDGKLAGQDAGTVVDRKSRNIPVFSSINELITTLGVKPEYAIIGMATKGGVLPESLYPLITEALDNRMHVVNGLHQPLSEVAEFKKAASVNKVNIYDIRKPKPFSQLHFWKGKILEVDCLKLAVLGTDCSIGKRTTTRMLVNALNEAGVKAEMIYTGQTGWLQGTKYGFIFDATPNDFIPGEIEHAVYSCWENEKPDVIIIEGQASLLNPGGPCGSEFIISARLDGVILQHHPIREKYNNLEGFPATIPDVMKDRQIIELMGVKTLAITLNTAHMSSEQIEQSRNDLITRSELPVVCPIEDGISEIVKLIEKKLAKGVVNL